MRTKKKSKFSRGNRVTAISTVLILSFVIGGLFYNEVFNKKYEQKKVTVYNYKINTNLNFRVNSISNILNRDAGTMEGNTYITEFVDIIELAYSLKFQGETTAAVKGDYKIKAVLEGCNSDKKTIWSKQFELMPDERFDFKDKNYSITKNVSVKLKEYNDFVKTFIEESKVNLPVKMSVIMYVNYEGSKDNNSFKGSISPEFIIPLNESYFEISKNYDGEKIFKVKALKEVLKPVSIRNTVFYGSAMAFSLLMLYILIFFTEGEKKHEPYVKNIKKILRVYRFHMEPVENIIENNLDKIYKVKSMEDLIRVSDEVGKPVVYKFARSIKKITKFYVMERSWAYVFDAADPENLKRNRIFGKKPAKNLGADNGLAV